MGGDLRKLDDPTCTLLTNDEVLSVNQTSRDNREIFFGDGLAAWAATDSDNGDTYIALFNLRDATPQIAEERVPVTSAQLGLRGGMRVRDLWRRSDIATVRDIFAPTISCHGAGLYRLSPE